MATDLKPLPYIRARNKFPLEARRAAIAYVSRDLHGVPEITDLCNRHLDGSAIIIGGGPSVDGYVESIRALQASGSILCCIERMYPWCHQHGLTPEYVVAQDASDDVGEAFTTLWPGSTYLIAAQCQRRIFDRLQEETVYFYHTSGEIPLEELGGPGTVGTLVNAGGSVTLGSFCLALFMGLSTVHLFGFDCHVTDGHYANGIAGVGVPPEPVRVYSQGRAFLTTLPYICFARQFFELKAIAEADGLLRRITVYGDSLVTSMSTEPIGASCNTTPAA